MMMGNYYSVEGSDTLFIASATAKGTIRLPLMQDLWQESRDSTHLEQFN